MSHAGSKRLHYEPVHVELVDPPNSYAPTCIDRSLLFVSFWSLGLLNNAPYVIMLACAKNISEGGTALVFLANIIPGLVIKLSAPYWFDKVSYNSRIILATLAMVSSFGLIASSSKLFWQLLGVSLASAQCGLGEASLLALAGKWDGDLAASTSMGGQCLTCFSSGTGLAGVFGFFWKWFWNDWLGYNFAVTLWSAQVLPLLYIGVYARALWCSALEGKDPKKVDILGQEQVAQCAPEAIALTPSETFAIEIPPATDAEVLAEPQSTPIVQMDGWKRFQLLLRLWPYMIPLFVVYFAEYALQSGTWTAIGFPVDDENARKAFFGNSNWMYQAGVFISRSSGALCAPPMWILWTMPCLQCVNLILFSMFAASQTIFQTVAFPWLSHPISLYLFCFYVGLLGGGVYISGFRRICVDVPPAYLEFSLAASSLAEDVGIMIADILGLFIQSCLYRANGLPGALVSCPLGT